MMERRKPLKADPEKVRAFLKRAKPLKGSEKPLARSQLRPGRPAPRRAPAGTDGSVAGVAYHWRVGVWEADEGRCVSCRKPVPRDGDLFSWQAHHPLLKQTMKRRGLRDEVYDVRFGVVLCTRCHEGHHGLHPVSGAKLPARVWAALEAVGVWAVDVVDRAHPGRDVRPQAKEIE
jgi:hypothetical protein